MTDLESKTQQLCELFAAIDARVNAIHDRQDESSLMMRELVQSHTTMLNQITALVAQNNEATDAKITEVKTGLADLDRRVSAVESITSTKLEQMKGAITFCVQLLWVILAAWTLLKLNLNAPP